MQPKQAIAQDSRTHKSKVFPMAKICHLWYLLDCASNSYYYHGTFPLLAKIVNGMCFEQTVGVYRSCCCCRVQLHLTRRRGWSKLLLTPFQCLLFLYNKLLEQIHQHLAWVLHHYCISGFQGGTNYALSSSNNHFLFYNDRLDPRFRDKSFSKWLHWTT